MNIFLLLFGYLCGSLPFGKIIGWCYGVDIQKRGSGNIGFANVRRVLGWRAGLLTLFGDITKGAFPTLVASAFTNYSFAFWVGIAAIAGHIFPIWLKFRGGKGLATGLGLMVVLHPVGAALGFMAYIAGYCSLKKSYVGSLLGAIILSVSYLLHEPAGWWRCVLLLTIACFTLRKNIMGTVPNHDTQTVVAD